MYLTSTFVVILPLFLFLPTEATFRARQYVIGEASVTYEEAWENCKANGMQLATGQSSEDNNELANLLNQPKYLSEKFWATDQDIDRSIEWHYTFNEGEMTLINLENGERMVSRFGVGSL